MAFKVKDIRSLIGLARGFATRFNKFFNELRINMADVSFPALRMRGMILNEQKKGLYYAQNKIKAHAHILIK